MTPCLAENIRCCCGLQLGNCRWWMAAILLPGTRNQKLLVMLEQELELPLYHWLLCSFLPLFHDCFLWQISCNCWWGRGCHWEARPRSGGLICCWCWRSWDDEEEAPEHPEQSAPQDWSRDDCWWSSSRLRCPELSLDWTPDHIWRLKHILIDIDIESLFGKNKSNRWFRNNHPHLLQLKWSWQT